MENIIANSEEYLEDIFKGSTWLEVLLEQKDISYPKAEANPY